MTADTRDPGPAPELPPIAAPPRRIKRWQAWVLGTIAVLMAVTTVVVMQAERFLEARLRAQLAERFEASVEIDRVDVDWSTLTIEAHGIRLDDGVRIEADIERVVVELSWEDLLGGKPQPRVVVHRPVITFQAVAAVPREPAQSDLDAFHSIELVDGTLEVVIPTARGPAFIDLTEIEARIDNRRRTVPDAKLDLGIVAHARVGEQGSLHVEARAASEAPARNWTADFELEGFELSTLNLLWLSIIEMDVDQGVLALDGALTRTPTHLRGRVRPRFEQVSLLGADEDALHPMAEALFGHMLMGARSTIAVDRPMTGDESSLPELLETDWQTLIAATIKQGYTRRLNTLQGFSANIGDVRVDLAHGLLQLVDVEIDTDHPVLEHPLIAIARVDVIFDPTVTQAGAPAYKHITLWQPRVSFATGVQGSDNRLQFDDQWLDTISAIPFPTRTLVVHDGRLDLWDFRQEEVVHLYADGIELHGREMARALHPTGTRGAELEATARLFGESKASVRMVYEPRAPVPNLDMDMLIEPVELVSLAPALRSFAGVDAVGGELGLSANLSARDREVVATVVPAVHRPKLSALGRGHFLRKIVLSRALGRIKSRQLELRYRQDPDEGLLHQFFPQLIQAVFFSR